MLLYEPSEVVKEGEGAGAEKLGEVLDAEIRSYAGDRISCFSGVRDI